MEGTALKTLDSDLRLFCIKEALNPRKAAIDMKINIVFLLTWL